MFDPSLGRWITEDPIGFEGGDNNLYRFVENNPLNYTDPSGLQKISVDKSMPDIIPSGPPPLVTRKPQYGTIGPEPGDQGTPEGKEAFWAGVGVITGGAAAKRIGSAAWSAWAARAELAALRAERLTLQTEARTLRVEIAQMGPLPATNTGLLHYLRLVERQKQVIARIGQVNDRILQLVR